MSTLEKAAGLRVTAVTDEASPAARGDLPEPRAIPPSHKRMELTAIDWASVAAFFVVSLGIGLYASKSAGAGVQEFFLSGRNMPWWVLGVSMVATTFSADTPNLVTGLVRERGVAGNWAWWAFLLTGMLTVFVYAKLWRRSGVTTDVEFYELRYSGKAAAFLRAFRALYLGVLFNVVVMGLVCLAAVKIGQVLLGFSAVEVLCGTSVVTLAYTWVGGLRAVLLTDLVQFSIAMIGSVWAAHHIVGLDAVGGLDALLAHPNVRGKLDLVPPLLDGDGASINPEIVKLLLVPLAVQWWAAWYPGAEPGGGGYVAQRMFAARDERHAVGATFLFNLAHYALRPWPWILIALASLVVYPDLDALGRAFPDVPAHLVHHDLGYSAMLTHLPHGLLGLVVASLMAALMSTLSTHLNWGASYVVHDVYLRFVDPQASQRVLVGVGRGAMTLMMILAAGIGMMLEDATRAFELILMLGSGTGPIYILRWFWWRINPISEITAMLVSFVVSCYFTFLFQQDVPDAERWPSHYVFVLSVAVTTAAWVLATLVTKPADSDTLRRFCEVVQPGGPGWRRFEPGSDMPRVNGAGSCQGKPWTVPYGLLAMLCGCLAIYGALLATGFYLYGDYALAIPLSLLSVSMFYLIGRLWPRLGIGEGR
ncbi:MAG: sodium:solute symporter family protein [Nannocystaceae bacterium]